MEEQKIKNHVHVPKRVREYMIELASMFIAVALAFISQYYFQYRSDRSTECNLMLSLKSDLLNDVNSVNIVEAEQLKTDFVATSFRSKCFNNLDTLESQKALYKNFIDFYYVARTPYFSHTTLNQLKNSGGLHLVINNLLKDKITAYDIGLSKIDLWNERMNLININGYEYMAKIFYSPRITHESDLSYLDAIYNTEGSALKTKDKAILMGMSGEMDSLTNYVITFHNLCTAQRKQAQELIKMIDENFKQ